MKIFKKAKRGFTLVELVVVIAVIAILAAVSVGAYFGVTESANNSRLEQETKQIHTALQTISLGTHDNQSLGKDGLRVNDIDQFELDLEASTGQEFEVLTNDPTLLSRQTIVLKTNEFVKEANGPTILYRTFEYYNPEISGKKVISSTINGEFKIEKIEAIPVDKNADDVTNTLVYFNNETVNWSKVYAYAWRSIDEVKNHSWPGVEMQKVSDGLYAYYLTSTFDKVIFNNGEESVKQTNDLEVPAKTSENNVYYCIGDRQGYWGTLKAEEPTLESVGLVGSMNGWDLSNPTKFKKDGDLWKIDDVVLYADDQFKVVLNNSYTFGELTTEGVNYYNIDDSKTLFSNNSGNIVVKTSAHYSITYNIETNTLHFEKGETVADRDYVAPGFISLAGTPTDWEKGDISLTATDETKQVWTGTFDLFKGEFFRFYFEGTWAKTYGFTHFAEDYSEWFEAYKEEDVAKDNNITVKTSGVYTFTVDTINKNISVEKVDTDFTATFEVIGQVCGGTWTTNDYIEVFTYNNETDLYEVTLEGCKAGEEFCIRRTNNWSSKVTTLASTGVENLTAPNNIVIGADGDYVLTVNPLTMEITNTFTDKEVTPDPDQPGEGGDTPVVQETITIYFENNWNWPTVNLYYWDAEENYNAVFPGEALEEPIGKTNKDYDVYRIEIPSDTVGIIFSGEGSYGEEQCENITNIAEDNVYYMVYIAEGNKKVCETYTFDVETTLHEHTYSSETGKCSCGKTCDHQYNDEDLCTICGSAKPEETSENTIYLIPNTEWKKDGARFAAYFFNNGETWVSMSLVEGETNVYKVVIPDGFEDVIFCRMNPSASANNWNNRFNQTADLKIPTDGTNCYTVKAGTWDKGGGTWSTYTPSAQ